MSILPPDFFSMLLGDQLGRDFLNRLEEPEKWQFPKCARSSAYQWIQLERLPVSPAKSESYDLLSSWQSVISATHATNSHLALALIRRKGNTRIYLGSCREKVSEIDNESAKRLSRAARIHMPGMGVKLMENAVPVQYAIEKLSYTGVVTGLPSSRFKQEGHINLLQTLDKLTYGVCDENGLDQDYALLILAQPENDQEITALTNKLLQLRNEIHRCVTKNVSVNVGENEGKGSNISFGSGMVDALCGAAGTIVGGLTGGMMLPGVGNILGASIGNELGKGISAILGFGYSKSKSHGFYSGENISHEEREFTAAYCDEMIGKHIQRLQSGRSLGFWNVGIYVMGENSDTVDAVLGMLRSIYAGYETYIEPIRTFNTGRNPLIRSYMENFQLLPLPGSAIDRETLAEKYGLQDGWHVFGELYEKFSTPMTTEELSLATSLPRRDVPGIRFVRNAVKMTANAPFLGKERRTINLGKILDMGMETGEEYYLDIDSLVRHVLNDGITGYGKSTTTQRILDGIASYNIPWLVIEPVKTDYVEQALEYNKTCAPEDRIHIYMPGFESFYGEKLEVMQFNPFQPCAPAGALLNIQGHLDALASLLTASVSMGEVLPLLMKEALQNLANHALGPDKKTGKWIANSNQADPADIQAYPKFSQLLKVVQELMRSRGYAAENHQNLTAAMETRIKSLLLGWKQDFFDAPISTTGEELFGRKVIINLIGIESDEDKAFFMSLILRALSEYRSSSYYYLPEYRAQMQKGDRLMHFTVVEEAHRLISVPTANYAGEANPQGKTAAMFSNMLREIRKWGEGLMIVDQQPSQLIPDAIKNTNLKIVHRMPSEDDRQAVGACMGLNHEQTELIAALNIGQAILASEHDDAALWIKVHYKKDLK